VNSIGKLSIAEAMGDLYGNNVRIITAISGFIGVAGIIAVELKVAGGLFEYALGVQPIYGIIFSGIVITLYSSLGGIKSVTLTDVVQFATFCVMIPVIGYFLFGNITNNQVITDTLTNNPIFDHGLVFSFSNPHIFYSLTLFIWAVLPSFNPAIFQRIAMADSTKQAGRSFTIASFICLLLAMTLCWIAVLVLSSHPSMDKNDIFEFIVNNSVWMTGFKGVVLIGVMAMVMSSVDSYINSSAVLITHDLRQALNISFIKNELLATRIGAMLIGSIAVLFAMREGSFFELFLWANMFYMPIVSVPFILAIMGFRSSTKAVLISMVGGFSSAIIWELFFKFDEVGGLVPGLIGNIVSFFASHYLLHQSRGWSGIKDSTPLLVIKEARKLKYEQIKKKIRSFNFIEGCVKNTPKGDGLMFFLGMYLMLSSMISVTMLPKDIHAHYVSWLDTLYPLVLCCTGPLTSYLLWLPMWRKDPRIIGIVWNVIMFYALICFSFLVSLMSNFAPIQLMVFMADIMIIATLVNWRWSLPAIAIGVLGTLIIYAGFAPPSIISQEVQTGKFSVLYLLLIIFSLIIIFLKPKQEYMEATEHKVDELEAEVDHLHDEITDLDEKVIHYSKE
jgi:Na+/proline symporter